LDNRYRIRVNGCGIFCGGAARACRQSLLKREAEGAAMRGGIGSVGAGIARPRATDGRPYGAGGALVPPVLVYEFFGGSKPPPYGEGGRKIERHYLLPAFFMI
jgi:hypothetical protein